MRKHSAGAGIAPRALAPGKSITDAHKKGKMLRPRSQSIPVSANLGARCCLGDGERAWVLIQCGG